MTRYLLLISIGLLAACSKKHTLPSDYVLQKENAGQKLVKFVQVEKDSLKTYATSVAAYGKYFSGVTYFKNTQDTALRVLFTTHTGLKLLDLQLSEEGCSTIYAVEQLQNPVVLKLLCHDFGLISTIKKEVQASQVYTNSAGLDIVVQKGDKDLYYYTNAKNDMIKVIETVPGKRKIQTEAYRESGDSSLVVKHRNFNFKMTLKKLTLD
ncbi:MAG: hypothetical protein JWM14_2965 [Chitinophagaceae bacterium]|nr:hypothetical protein [Chitinophagaceae bacterium]